jgi:predicted acyltransferase
LWASAVLLVGYWAACVALAQGPDPYALETWFGTAIDRAVFGPAHLYQGEGVPFDPEGLASTLPAIAQVLAGYAVGVLLLQDRDEASRLRGLLIIALVAVAAGWVWSMSMPINKKIWTSSYVLLTTGLAAAGLAALRVAISGLQGVRLPFEPLWRACEAFGRNALLIFALSGLVPRTLGLLRIEDGADASGTSRSIAPLPWLHRELFAPMTADPRLGSLLYALAMLAFYWLIARTLQRRGWYFRA